MVVLCPHDQLLTSLCLLHFRRTLFSLFSFVFCFLLCFVVFLSILVFFVSEKQNRSRPLPFFFPLFLVFLSPTSKSVLTHTHKKNTPKKTYKKKKAYIYIKIQILLTLTIIIINSLALNLFGVQPTQNCGLHLSGQAPTPSSFCASQTSISSLRVYQRRKPKKKHKRGKRIYIQRSIITCVQITIIQ